MVKVIAVKVRVHTEEATEHPSYRLSEVLGERLACTQTVVSMTAQPDPTTQPIVPFGLSAAPPPLPISRLRSTVRP